MEKMTVSILSVLHGSDDVLCDAETLQAETREELASTFAAFLRQLADTVEAAAGVR